MRGKRWHFGLVANGLGFCYHWRRQGAHVAISNGLETRMLVLSRKLGERIRIGDAIVVTIVRISGGGVRLGIEAPSEMPVVREELFNRLQDMAAEIDVVPSGEECEPEG